MSFFSPQKNGYSRKATLKYFLSPQWNNNFSPFPSRVMGRPYSRKATLCCRVKMHATYIHPPTPTRLYCARKMHATTHPNMRKLYTLHTCTHTYIYICARYVHARAYCACYIHAPPTLIFACCARYIHAHIYTNTHILCTLHTWW
jgi:hypothetical protein